MEPRLLAALELIAEHLGDISAELRDLNEKAVYMQDHHSAAVQYHDTRIALLGGPVNNAYREPSFKKFLPVN